MKSAHLYRRARLGQALILSLLAFAACIALAACGGSDNGPVAEPRAIAFANMVNLRGDDVPGMGTLASGFKTRNGPPYGSCATHIGASDEVAGVESPWFVRSRGQRRLRAGVIVGTPPVAGGHSVVYVMRKSGVASQNVAAARRASVPDCVERLSVRDALGPVSGGEPYKRQIKASSLPFPLTGVAGYWLRVRGTVAGRVYHEKKRLSFYEDTFGFAVGPAEIVLHANGVVRPFPSAEERRLLFLLYERAKAHALA
jgi:hypothetical protein